MSGRGGSRGGYNRGGRGGYTRGGRGGYNRGGYEEQASEHIELLGSFMHACEGDMICKSVNEKIPYFNAPIYLENKTQIGRVDEILGPINQVQFSIKVADGVVATSFKAEDKVFIGSDKLLPLERFLPKPKGPKTSKPKGPGGARGGFRGGSRGGFGGGRGGRGGRGGFNRDSGGRGGYGRDSGGRGGFNRDSSVRGGYNRDSGGRGGYSRGGYGRGGY